MIDRLTTNNKGHGGGFSTHCGLVTRGTFVTDKLEIISIFAILKSRLPNHFSPFVMVHALV